MAFPSHWSGWLIWAVAFGPLLFTAIRINRSAAVLFAAWLAAEAISAKLPIREYMVLDPIAIALIVRWRWSALDTIRATPFGDRLILGVYPAMWLAYALPLTQTAQWWALWWLALAQMAIAVAWPAFAANRTAEGRRIRKFHSIFRRGGA